jgi:hypothetical protein
MGYCNWLVGKKKKAVGVWARGLKEAERLGARVEGARIHMEIGRHLKEMGGRESIFQGFKADECLQRARRLFEEKGLEEDLMKMSQIGAA